MYLQTVKNFAANLVLKLKFAFSDSVTLILDEFPFIYSKAKIAIDIFCKTQTYAGKHLEKQFLVNYEGLYLDICLENTKKLV